MPESVAGGKRFPWRLCTALIVLVGLGALALIVSRNLKRPLQPEDLEAARGRWVAHEPDSYTIVYTVLLPEHRQPDRFVLQVRNKKAVSGTVNNEPISSDRLHYYGMNKLFDYIEAFMKKSDDKKQASRFLAGEFDPHTGALRWFSRRELGGKEKMEIHVESLTDN